MTSLRNAYKLIVGGMLLACAALSGTAIAQAGFVSGIEGTVTAITASGDTVTLKNGDTFQPGTTFATGDNAQLVIKFTDGEVVALGANSSVRVGAYQYIPANLNGSQSVITLLNGNMRLVAGAIGTNNPAGLQINVGTTSSASLSRTVTRTPRDAR